MTQASDFKTGERVAHVHMGDGVVVEGGDVVRVKYDDWGSICSYDAEWFRAHPRYLFHRRTNGFQKERGS